MFSTTASAPSTSTSNSNTHSSDYHYYTNEEVKILHDVVRRAQVIYGQLPESERIATNALWKACDEVSEEIGVNYFDRDRHMSKIIFYIGGQRGPGTLLDKFRDVMLRRYQIELEFDHAQDDDDEGDDDGVGKESKRSARVVTSYGRGSDEEDDESDEDDETDQRHYQQRALGDEDEDADDAEETERGDQYGPQNDHHHHVHHRTNRQFEETTETEQSIFASPAVRPPKSQLAPPTHLEPTRLPFTHLEFGIGDPRNTSSGLPPDAPPSFSETDESPHSLESLQGGQRVASDTTVQDLPGIYKFTGNSTSSTQPPSFTFPPPAFHRPSALRPMPVDYSLPFRPKTTKTVTFRSPTLTPDSTRSVPRHEESSPPRAPLSQNRQHHVVEEEPYDEVTEETVQEYEPIHALDYDEIPEEDPVEQARRERRAARAHLILLTQHVLDRWCRFADEKAERTAVARRHMLRYRYFGAWRSITLDEEDYESSDVTDPSVVADVSAGNTSAVNASAALHDLSDPNLTLPSWPPVNVDPGVHWAFLEKTARNWRDERIRRTVLDRWRAWLGSIDGFRVENRQDEQQQAQGKLVPAATGADRCLVSWRDLANDEERALRAADTILMGQVLRRWQPDNYAREQAKADTHFSRCLHGSVSHRSREFIQSIPSPNGTLSRQLQQSAPPSFEIHSADPMQVAQSVAMFENIIASRCLTLWAAMLYYENEDREHTEDYWASIAVWVALGAWDKSQEQHRQWEAWAQRGDWYLQTTRVFDHWNGDAARARKQRERDIFAHVKKSQRARLAKRSLRVWTEFVDQIDHDEKLVAQHTANDEWTEVDYAIEDWQEWADQDNEAHSSALDLFGQHSLSAWLDGHQEVGSQTELATDAWGEQAKSQCLTRWTLAQLQLNGRQRMVVDAREQNDRKIFRSCFEGWAELVQPPGQTPAAQTPGTGRRGAARLVGIHRRNAAESAPRQPRTPWTAPTLPIRGRPVKHGRRQPITVAFEAGDPDEEEAEEPQLAPPPAPPRRTAASAFSRSLGLTQTTTPRTPAIGDLSRLRRGGGDRTSNPFDSGR